MKKRRLPLAALLVLPACAAPLPSAPDDASPDVPAYAEEGKNTMGSGTMFDSPAEDGGGFLGSGTAATTSGGNVAGTGNALAEEQPEDDGRGLNTMGSGN